MLQKNRIELRQCEFNCRVVGTLGLAHGIGIRLNCRRWQLRSLDRKHHVIRSERRAVMKFDAAAQIKTPTCRGQLRPLGCEGRCNFQCFVAVY